MGIIDNALPENKIGYEVLKINGKEMSEIIETIQPLLANDGNSEEMIGASFPFLLWAVNTSHPYSVEILNKETGLPEILELQGTNDLDKFRTQKPIGIKPKLEDFITFELLDKNKGYINAKSFGFVQYKSITKAFEKELETYFAELKEKGVSNLIIDLRENGGGSSYPAEAILQKIAHKPYQQTGGSTMRVSRQFGEFLDGLPWAIRMIAKKGSMKDYDLYPIGTNIKEESKPILPKKVKNSFSGQVYVLIGPNTHSAAMMMANAVEDFDLGILVGEPTKSIPRELSNALPLKTPNAKIAFVVPASLFARANGDENNFEPVKPDVIINTTSKDIEQKEGDPVMQYVLKRITSGN
jgi:C-terminal processing protease CtpA/Prc